MKKSMVLYGLLVLMIAASASAMALRPTHRIADEGQKVDLERMIPKQFGDWSAIEQSSGQIVNPQQTEALNAIYTQLLSRTYVNAKGETVMLSIAYGSDQSDAKALHYPEVCYPAQGFQVLSNQPSAISTDFGDIRVKRLQTVMGNRSEPLIYWSTVGDKVVVGGKETKLEQLRYGFKGQIPDGLLFRVSSLTNEAESGYINQQNFVRDLLAASNPADRSKLAGLNQLAKKS